MKVQYRNSLMLTMALFGIAAVVVPGCTYPSESGSRVVEAGNNELTITNEGGAAATYDVAPEAQITLDENPAELHELDAGDAVDVMTEEREGERVAMRVDAVSHENLGADDVTTDSEDPMEPMDVNPERPLY